MSSVSFGKKRFAINLAANMFAFTLNLLIGFFLSPYIVDTLGKVAHGYVSLGSNFIMYVTLLSTALNSFSGRYIMIEEQQNRPDGVQKYFNSVYFGNIFLILCLIAPCTLLIVFLNKVINISDDYFRDVQILWAFLFLTLFINLLSGTYKTSTFVKNRLDLSAINEATANLLRVVLLLILFCILRPSVWIIGIVALICAIYKLTVNRSYQRKLMPYLKPQIRFFDMKAVKTLCAKGIWNSFYQLSAILLLGLDLLIANLLINEEQMSYLSIAKVIPGYFQSFILMICAMFNPGLTFAYARNDIQKIVKEEHFAIKFVSFLSIVPLMGLIVFGARFLRLWMPALSPDEITKVHLLLVLTILPMVLSVFIQPLIAINTITAKVRLPVIVTASLGVLNIIFVFFLLQTTTLGIYAVAGVSSVFLLMRNIFFVPMYAAHSLNLKWKTFYKCIFRGVLCSAGIFIFFRVIYQYVPIETWSTLLITAVIAGVLGESLVFQFLFSREEKKQVLQFIRQRFLRSKTQ